MAKYLTDADREERRQITNLRQNAVRQAWKDEQNRVKQGKGTRNWSVKEQKKLLETGGVKGYQGHHMKCVSVYPKEAGVRQNIQFLTDDEHVNGAHQGDTHNPTNGYYDPNTGTMNEFMGDELVPPPEITLSESYSSTEEVGQDTVDYMGTTAEEIETTAETYGAENYMGKIDDFSAHTNGDDGKTADNFTEMD